MSADNVFDLWQFAYVMPIYRTLGGVRRIVRGDVTTTLHDERVEWRTQFRPMAGVDYVDAVFDLACFDLTGDDDGSVCRCPCGESIAAADVGELLESIREHCKERHPKALKVVWPK